MEIDKEARATLPIHPDALSGIPLLVIAGPTAAGKTGVALALAEELGAEIVSCDSIAVYRGCDVGAAKPTAEERARVPHHLLDLVEPDRRFSAADYVEAADRAIAEVAARGRPVVVVGGTGLYLRALLLGLFPSPPPDPSWRAELRGEAERIGWPALHARLASVDAAAAARIARTDRVRIERALEVYAQIGEPLSLLQERHREGGGARYRAFTAILDPGAAELDRRIALRTDAMLAAGLVEETRCLARRYGRDLKPLGALGYKEALAHLDGHLAAAELGPAIQRATRRFAKRQRTWFAKLDTDDPNGAPTRRIASLAELPARAMQEFLVAAAPVASPALPRRSA